jgi:type II secretory pathway component PulF
MFFSRRLPLGELVRLCHVARINLSAGLTLRDVFRQQATRGSPGVRAVAARISEHLERGDDLRVALKAEKAVFTPLFLALTTVGEQTGHLPEILEELEKYYLLQQKAWRQVRSSSLLPAIQFILAIGVIALVIFVLGLISESRGTQPQTILGFRGTSGAIQFLVSCGAVIGGLCGAYLFITRTLHRKALLDGLLLRFPSVGGCVRAFVVARFALAMQLTLDTSLAIGKAIRLSLEAAGNAVYLEKADVVVAAVDDGEDLAVALSRAQVFPADFLSMVAIAEEGGRVVEIMKHQAAQYHEEAVRRLKALVGRITALFWLIYVGFMIMAIMNLAGVYLQQLGG